VLASQCWILFILLSSTTFHFTGGSRERKKSKTNNFDDGIGEADAAATMESRAKSEAYVHIILITKQTMTT
jgi:hypothetical protein